MLLRVYMLMSPFARLVSILPLYTLYFTMEYISYKSAQLTFSDSHDFQKLIIFKKFSILTAICQRSRHRTGLCLPPIESAWSPLSFKHKKCGWGRKILKYFAFLAAKSFSKFGYERLWMMFFERHFLMKNAQGGKRFHYNFLV